MATSSKSSLAKRLIGATGKASRAAVLSESSYFDKQGMAKHTTLIMNLLFSGTMKSGISYGTTTVVGDSRTFKSNFCLSVVADFLAQNPDSVCVYVDSEFGASRAYFSTFGIDVDRVIHVPVENIEQMTFDLVQILNEIDGDKERVCVFIDSVSQTASKKEAADAQEGNGTTDMTRARSLNSFWRVINPIANLKKIPVLAINSFYEDISNKYADKIIKGGKQGFLSSDNVFFVTRAKVKDDKTKELVGWTFNYRAMKSRFIVENSDIPITVTYDEGIDPLSGMFDLMREGGFITMPMSGWYNIGSVCTTIKPFPANVRKADIETPELIRAIAESEEFDAFVQSKFKIGVAKAIPAPTYEDDDSGAVKPPEGAVADAETGELVAPAV